MVAPGDTNTSGRLNSAVEESSAALTLTGSGGCELFHKNAK